MIKLKKIRCSIFYSLLVAYQCLQGEKFCYRNLVTLDSMMAGCVFMTMLLGLVSIKGKIVLSSYSQTSLSSNNQKICK